MRGRLRGRGMLGAGVIALCLQAQAGTLELRQGEDIGAGTGFQRGDSCIVLTAAHVVQARGVEVQVQDRSGARAKGQVSYSNPAYDVALVTLDPGSAVLCSERWPESDWMASATWTPRSEFDVARHYPNGRVSVMALRWAGGTQDTLTLRPADKMEIRSSDSGSLVRQGDKPAGIIKQVDTAIDRVEVVRFDLIDRLVGERFRGSGAGAVALEGVFNRGRAQANWTSYVAAWLTETARRPLVPAGDAAARCRVRAEVIDWSQRNVPNPRTQSAQEQLASCRTNILFRNSARLIKMCEDGARSNLKSEPRTLRVHSVQLKVDVAPRSGAALSKLRTVDATLATDTSSSRADVEMAVMQNAFADVAQEMLRSGVCD
jgi:hypothetical protein